MVVENRIGNIILNGTGRENSIRYPLYKSSKAKTEVAAEENLSRIGFVNIIKKDTFDCAITAPENSSSSEYYCGLSMDIPFDMPAIINNPNQRVFTSNKPQYDFPFLLCGRHT